MYDIRAQHSSHSSAIVSYLTVYEISLQLGSPRFLAISLQSISSSTKACPHSSVGFNLVIRRALIIFFYLVSYQSTFRSTRRFIIASKLCNYSYIKVLRVHTRSVDMANPLAEIHLSITHLSFCLFPLTVAAEEPKAEGGQPR